MARRAELPAAPGSYLLWLELTAQHTLAVGRLGRVRFPAGHYGYCGSARGPGGLAARVGRHLRGDGRPHWHVDRLRAVAAPREVWFWPDPGPDEHALAAALAAAPGLELVAPGFGASDCRCPGHLFRAARPPAPALLRRAGWGATLGRFQPPSRPDPCR
ncbi:MAG: GIY-YIG nuclease family protein [Planctomycetota bacterium]|nr:MAG: GIY-YIG nuclease family protein [Planctomycetota bacterium]